MASDKAADDFKVSAIQAAKPFREEIAGRIERFYKDNPPKLVGFLANAGKDLFEEQQSHSRRCIITRHIDAHRH